MDLDSYLNSLKPADEVTGYVVSSREETEARYAESNSLSWDEKVNRIKDLKADQEEWLPVGEKGYAILLDSNLETVWEGPTILTPRLDKPVIKSIWTNYVDEHSPLAEIRRDIFLYAPSATKAYRERKPTATTTWIYIKETK